MLIIGVVVVGLLLLTSTFRPAHSALSFYELRRRKEMGDQGAAEVLRRERLLAQAEALKQPLAAVLLMVLALVLVATFGWYWGASGAVIIALFYTRVSSLPILHRRAQKFYKSREAALLRVVDRRKKVFGIVTGSVSPSSRTDAFGSREELFHRISESGVVLSSQDKNLLTHALAFTQRRAIDAMTSREDIVTIEHTEMLGPLVLSDLHKTGHSCFPVIVRNPDHIVGMLDIRGLLTLEAKRTITAAKAMSGNAFYIRGDQTLDHALSAFIRTRHHLLVVIDEEGATLGLLTLRDVLEALFGRSLSDEFASDSDLHLVAKRHL